METNDNEKQPSGWSKDTVLVRWTVKWLPKDSPEFQARANLPLSARGPNLALYHELQKANDEPKPAGEQPPSA